MGQACMDIGHWVQAEKWSVIQQQIVKFNLLSFN